MKDELILRGESEQEIWIRSIKEEDNCLLREWKNKNRRSFFFQEIISWQQQINWYSNYLDRADDFMFVAMDRGTPFGCLGFRVQDENIDLYNIIRGVQNVGKSGMHKAMNIMLQYIKNNYKGIIKCDVLKNNKAVMWYQECGFALKEDLGYYVMEIDRKNIREI